MYEIFAAIVEVFAPPAVIVKSVVVDVVGVTVDLPPTVLSLYVNHFPPRLLIPFPSSQSSTRVALPANALVTGLLVNAANDAPSLLLTVPRVYEIVNTSPATGIAVVASVKSYELVPFAVIAVNAFDTAVPFFSNVNLLYSVVAAIVLSNVIVIVVPVEFVVALEKSGGEITFDVLGAQKLPVITNNVIHLIVELK